MARYIDAVELQRKICGAKCGCEYEDCGCEGDCVFEHFIFHSPTADVVPRAEVAREIFEEMQSCLIQRHWKGLDIVSFEFDAVKYAKLKKKYTEDNK